MEIEKLVADRGEVISEAVINEEITNFYKNLYERGDSPENVLDDSFFNNIVKIKDSDAVKVTAPLLKEEL
jgi:hypothetical protein